MAIFDCECHSLTVSSLLSKALVYIYINNKRIYKYKNNGVVMVVTKVKIM